MLDYETNANEVSNMTAMCGMISWTGILWTSIRWNKGLKAQGIDRKTLPYMAPLQPYLSYCSFYKILFRVGDTNFCDFSDGISICVMVIIFGGFGSFSEFARHEAPRSLY